MSVSHRRIGLPTLGLGKIEIRSTQSGFKLIGLEKIPSEHNLNM